MRRAVELASPEATLGARGNPMGRFIALLYGLASYVVFFGAFLYAIGFVGGLVGAQDSR